MKTIKLTLLALLLPFMCFAQGKEKLPIDLLGVDFSCVNIVGAIESDEQFQNAFEGINALLKTEPKKYDISKYLSLDVMSINTDKAVERIDMYGADKKSKLVIEDIIAAYPKEAGNKLLIVAVELNKTKAKATYIAVIFNGETKEVIYTKELVGKSAGFGLRNYWAGSLYNGLKKSK